jgi:hypothetical protein
VAGNAFDLATAGGADMVHIEIQDFSGNSVIKGPASVSLGDGNDTLYIGSPAQLPNGGLKDSTRVRFFAGLMLDAGAGSDTRNDLLPQNDFLGDAPVNLGTFETVLPNIII